MDIQADLEKENKELRKVNNELRNRIKELETELYFSYRNKKNRRFNKWQR